MTFLQFLLETESSTLKSAHARSEKRSEELKKAGKGRMGDRVNAKTFQPNKNYPAPWKRVESKEGINAIYAANGKRVADYLSRSQAENILKEIK